MDKQQTSREDVYEQYVDASVALFMKYYCDTLYEDVTEKGSLSENKGGDGFPEELDVRCRSLIKKTVRRQQIREKARYAGKVLRVLCSFAIVCLSLASLLFMTVEAVRVPIINYYIKHSENNFLEIGGYGNSAEEPLEATFDISDPLKNIVPEEYSLVTQEGDSISNLSAIYKNSHNCSIFLSAYPLAGVSDIDMQGAENVQYFQIYNCKAIMAQENNITRLIWIDEEISTTFTLIISNDSGLDAIEIADDFIRIIS